MKKILLHTGFLLLFISIFSYLQFGRLNINSAYAEVQTLNTQSSALNPAGDPTKDTFRIVVCDGPHNPKGDASVILYDNNGKKIGERPYVVCDFNGAMLTVQHLINIAIVIGIFAAIILFTYAGYLMMTGKEADRNKAKDIFPKIFGGFVIMLSAWFIVYQILNWLTDNDAFTKLLGNP